MVDIISKRDGPRREDVAARRMLQDNRGTIHKMMDHLTGGQLNSRAQKAAPPEPEGLVIHTGRVIDTRGAARPYVRISVNGRVVVADQETSRQLHFLGEIRGPRRSQRFVLATRENGFFALVEDDLGQKLADLDGRALAADFTEDDLVRIISQRLGIDEDDVGKAG
ncbi:MAG: hypothetical protein R3F54_09340 [Alphaproteobacteria bacterium]